MYTTPESSFKKASRKKGKSRKIKLTLGSKMLRIFFTWIDTAHVGYAFLISRSILLQTLNLLNHLTREERCWNRENAPKTEISSALQFGIEMEQIQLWPERFHYWMISHLFHWTLFLFLDFQSFFIDLNIGSFSLITGVKSAYCTHIRVIFEG